ncbi:MHO_1580 family protein [Mycoplasma sp. VS1572C]
MINLDLITQNDTYTVNERRIKVNTLVSDNAINNFHALFAINIDRIGSNGFTDITVAFEDNLYDWRQRTKAINDISIIPIGISGHIAKWVSDRLIKRTLPIYVSVFVNNKEYINFMSDGVYKKQIKRIPYSTLGLQFDKLESIVVQFATSESRGKELIPLKDYQLIFKPYTKEKIQISPLSNSAKIRVPYSYNINFESNKEYWKELFYHNIIINLEELNNKKHHSKIISAYEFNDKKYLKFPSELSFNEYIPISFDNLIINEFMDGKIKLNTMYYDQSNALINKDDYYSSGVSYDSKISDLLYTNEVDKKIEKIASPQSSYNVKIPYKFDGEFTAVYELSTHYFSADIIKKFSVQGTNEYDNSFIKKLRIIEIAPKKDAKYKFVINLSKEYTNIFSNDFNIQDYLIIEEQDNKFKRLN